MSTRVAFMGFRHPHVYTALSYLQKQRAVEIVGCCEEDSETRERIEREGRVRLTHGDLNTMLREADFSVLIVGDYFAKRGGIVMRALDAERHVLCDKPISTDLDELTRIRELARQKDLKVGSLLELRYSGSFIRLREIVHNGRIGQIHSISFDGQHPLLREDRPGWYFEEGKQGGTINDLLVHAVDTLTWITGQEVTRIFGVREWSTEDGLAALKNGAHVMLGLESGCGVLGDLSYLSPDSFGYGLPFYWRFTLWGSGGVAETSFNQKTVRLYEDGQDEAVELEAAAHVEGGAFRSLLKLMEGQERSAFDYSQEDIFRSSYVCLKVQQASDWGLCDIGVPLAATAR